MDMNELPETYQRVFGTPAGKKVLEDLHFQANRPIKGFDPNEALYAEGRRNIIRYISNQIKAAELK